jgi:hypothetical protein
MPAFGLPALWCVRGYRLGEDNLKKNHHRPAHCPLGAKVAHAPAGDVHRRISEGKDWRCYAEIVGGAGLRLLRVASATCEALACPPLYEFGTTVTTRRRLARH